jgi:hypothetical protein
MNRQRSSKAYGLPVVKETPLALEPVVPDTFGGLTGPQAPTTPRRGSR